MRILAVAPGLRECGVALFEDEELVRAQLVRSPVEKKRDAVAWTGMADAVTVAFPEAVDVLAVEMVAVRRGRWDGNPDDLMQLVGVAGTLIGRRRVAKPRLLRPEHWRGFTPKRIHHQRLLRGLRKAERAHLEELAQSMNSMSMSEYVRECRRLRGSSHPSDPIHNVIDAIGVGLWVSGR